MHKINRGEIEVHTDVDNIAIIGCEKEEEDIMENVSGETRVMIIQTRVIDSSD